MPDRKAKRTIPFHEAANIFPLMEGQEFQALMDDIRKNGLKESILLYVDKNGDTWIIDGRNRYNAVLRLQEQGHPIQHKFREWDSKGSLTAFVVSLNLHRRHLDESQRAMIVARISNERRGGNRKSTPINGSIEPLISRGQAAGMMSVSPASAKRASKVLRHGDEDLISAVQSGEVSVSAATQVIDAAQKYPEVAAIIPKSRPHEFAKIAKNLDALPEKTRGEKIKKLVKNDLATLREMTDRAPVPTEKPSLAKEIAEWCMGARSTASRFKRRGGIEWTDRDKEMALEGLDLLTEDLDALRNDILGGMTHDRSSIEEFEEAIN